MPPKGIREFRHRTRKLKRYPPGTILTFYEVLAWLQIAESNLRYWERTRGLTPVPGPRPKRFRVEDVLRAAMAPRRSTGRPTKATVI